MQRTEHTYPTLSWLEGPGVESDIVERDRGQPGNLTFPRARRVEYGVHGVDLHEPNQGCLNEFSINVNGHFFGYQCNEAEVALSLLMSNSTI